MLLILLVTSADVGQGQIIVNAGYGTSPSAVHVAPGQITTFYLPDYANNATLPIIGSERASAAGLFVLLTGVLKGNLLTGSPGTPVEIVRIEQVTTTCVNCGRLTAVTLAMPMNLLPN